LAIILASSGERANLRDGLRSDLMKSASLAGGCHVSSVFLGLARTKVAEYSGFFSDPRKLTGPTWNALESQIQLPWKI
jgi:hypothetical protein